MIELILGICGGIALYLIFCWKIRKSHKDFTKGCEEIGCSDIKIGHCLNLFSSARMKYKGKQFIYRTRHNKHYAVYDQLYVILDRSFSHIHKKMGNYYVSGKHLVLKVEDATAFNSIEDKQAILEEMCKKADELNLSN